MRIGLGVGIPGMGGSPAFDPTLVAGLKLWLRADQGTYQDAAMTIPAVADGANVLGWQDMSGQGNSPTTAIGHTTTLKLNIQNGLPGVLFDGTASYLQKMLGATLAQPSTIMMVFRQSSVAVPQKLFDGTGSSRNSVYANPTVYDIYAGIIVPGGTPNTSVHQVTAVWNGASSLARLDGTQIITGDAGAQAAGAFTLGVDAGLAVQFLSGYLHEVFFYNALLSAGDQANLESFLKTRWGTP